MHIICARLFTVFPKAFTLCTLQPPVSSGQESTSSTALPCVSNARQQSHACAQHHRRSRAGSVLSAAAPRVSRTCCQSAPLPQLTHTQARCSAAQNKVHASRHEHLSCKESCHVKQRRACRMAATATAVSTNAGLPRRRRLWQVRLGELQRERRCGVAAAHRLAWQAAAGLHRIVHAACIAPGPSSKLQK